MPAARCEDIMNLMAFTTELVLGIRELETGMEKDWKAFGHINIIFYTNMSIMPQRDPFIPAWMNN